MALLAATVCVAPALVSFAIRAALFGRDRALQGSSQALSLVPGIAGQYLRRAFFCRVLDECHASVTIEFGTLFSRAGARLGEHVYVGPHCHLGLVHLERDVLIAAGVHVPSGPDTHGTSSLDRPIREQPGSLRMVRIGAGSWIGSGAVVMADVGRDSVVGGRRRRDASHCPTGSSRLACLRASYASAAPAIGPAREAAVSHAPAAVRPEPRGSHPRVSPAEGARPVRRSHARLAGPRRRGSGPRRATSRGSCTKSMPCRVTPWRNKLRALPALATGRPLTHVLLDGPTLDRDGRGRGPRRRPVRRLRLLLGHGAAGEPARAREHPARARHGGRGLGQVGDARQRRAVAAVRHLRARGAHAAAVRG